MARRCEHVQAIQVTQTRATGCEDCMRIGGHWMHLRLCMVCGHVGCCDSSQHKHASRHFQLTGHPIVRSIEPGEAWGWCYVDAVEFELTGV